MSPPVNLHDRLPLVNLVTFQGGFVETPKQEVQGILNSLPEDATLDDIQYRIYVRQAIDRGLQDIDRGRILTQAAVEQRMARWIKK